MVNQFLDRFHEELSVRQANMPFKRGFVLPSRMHMKQPRVASRTERVNAQAPRLLGSWRKDSANGFFDVLLFARLCVKARKNEKLHSASL